MIEMNTYPTQSLVSESSMHAFELARQKKGKKSNALSSTLYGVTKGKAGTELVYLVRRSQEDKAIVNMLPFGASILVRIAFVAAAAALISCFLSAAQGSSRVIFYGLLEFLLNMSDPRRVDLCYCDTDSVFLHVRGRNFDDVVLDEKRAEYELLKADVFETPGDPATPAGKLKLEGKFARGFFRGIKTYALEPFGASKLVKKAKGIPKRVLEEMDRSDFQNLPNHLNFQNVAIAPTIGGQIGLVVRSKRAIAPLNTKRRVLADGSNTAPLN